MQSRLAVFGLLQGGNDDEIGCCVCKEGVFLSQGQDVDDVDSH